MDQFGYIREYYGIHLAMDMRVTDASGRPGKVVGATHYVQVLLDGYEHTTNYHPNSLQYPPEARCGTPMELVP